MKHLSSGVGGEIKRQAAPGGDIETSNLRISTGGPVAKHISI